ncbi:MAG: putative sulfate exporter family transporter [Chloroflexi bacterium]|nr:putative sulfate exporter family transporter [Chloroflexota bacterium]
MAIKLTQLPRPKLSAPDKFLLGIPYTDLPTLLTGLLSASLLAWFSIWLSEYLGTALLGFTKSPISSVMMAIVLGLIIGNLVRLPAAIQPGLNFSVKKVLRLGIILLGIRLSIVDILQLGVLGVPIVLLCILGALLLTTQLSRHLQLPWRLGMLMAVGTSICGVSAIVATGPAIKAKDEEVAYSVAVITIFGMIATLLYPYLAHFLFGSNSIMAGLFLGTAIHDTSQVTGAALVFADLYNLPRAIDVATVTKLVRNVFIAVIVPLMAILAQREAPEDEQTGLRTNPLKLLPLFILGFIGFAVVRSLGDLTLTTTGSALGLWSGATWKGVYSVTQDWAINFLTIALAAVGLTTRFQVIKGLGYKPFLVGLGAAVAVGGISFIAITLLGSLVSFG